MTHRASATAGYNPTVTSKDDEASGLFGLIARDAIAAVEDALVAAMGRLGYTPAPGLSIACHQPGLDPHERPARFFRLRERDGLVAIIELGSQKGADYFLAAALASTGLDEVVFISTEGAPPSGAIALLSARREPREVWFERGAIDRELSTMLDEKAPTAVYAGPRSRDRVDSIAAALELLTPHAPSAARFLQSAGADDGSLDFAAGNEEVLAFCLPRVAAAR